MTGALAFARAHWRGLSVAASILLALGGGFAWGWHAHEPPPAPAVKATEQLDARKSRAEDVTVAQYDGPATRVHLNFDPAPPGCPSASQPSTVQLPGVGPVQVPAGERLESADLEEDGPSETDTHAVGQEQEEKHKLASLTVTPPPERPPPTWALQLGLEDALGARTMRLAARRRVLGPLWLELSARPADRQVGAAIAVEW